MVTSFWHSFSMWLYHVNVKGPKHHYGKYDNVIRNPKKQFCISWFARFLALRIITLAPSRWKKLHPPGPHISGRDPVNMKMSAFLGYFSLCIGQCLPTAIAFMHDFVFSSYNSSSEYCSPSNIGDCRGVCFKPHFELNILQSHFSQWIHEYLSPRWSTNASYWDYPWKGLS